jgi:hypothetical protein
MARMSNKQDSKQESGAAAEKSAGTGTGTGTGSATSQPRPAMPWEMFGGEAFARGQEMFARLVQENVTRTHKLLDELAGYEAVAVERARAAVSDLARLATDSLEYGVRLSAEWRKLAVDTSRRVVEQTAPRA